MGEKVGAPKGGVLMQIGGFMPIRKGGAAYMGEKMKERLPRM